MNTATTTAINLLPAILIAAKTVLDQVPGMLDSAARTRDAWRRLRSKGTEEPQQDSADGQAPTTENDEEPPAAA